MFKGKHGKNQITKDNKLCSYELSDVEDNSGKFRFPSGDLKKYFDIKVGYARRGDVRPFLMSKSAANSIVEIKLDNNRAISASIATKEKYYYAVQLTLQNVGNIAKIKDDCQQPIEDGEWLEKHLFGRKFDGYVPCDPFNF